MRRYPWHYALFLVAYYMANAVYQGFITVYFKDVGLSTLQIGALMSAVPIVSILTQPLWGALGDRAKSRNNVLRIMAAGAAGSPPFFERRIIHWDTKKQPAMNTVNSTGKAATPGDLSA